jgi:hypothetical protein
LDLDAVYGLGPDGSPHLYARNPENTSKHGPKLLIARTSMSISAASLGTSATIFPAALKASL